MVERTPNDEAISDQMDKEIKVVLRDRLGAELVESITPGYPDDPDVPNMRYPDALSEILPWLMPEISPAQQPRRAGVRRAGLRRDVGMTTC